jgi:polyisoprenoid-binding protein YceI
MAAACVLAALPCHAAPLVLTLSPATAHIGLTVFAMGMVRVEGHFERFSGRLVLDPGAPAPCRVSLDVEVASLRMEGPGRTRLALGPFLLDAAHYPALHYAAACGTAQPVGALTLHGITHTLALETHRDGDTVSATGRLHRFTYGVSGLPGFIGGTVELHLSATLPPGLALRVRPD